MIYGVLGDTALSSATWLQLRTEDMEVLGRRQAIVVMDVQGAARLNETDVNISFSSVEDVKEAFLETEKGIVDLVKTAVRQV